MSLTREEQFLKIFKNSIRIDARTISVKTLLSERNIKRINYNPYYQRNYVWDIVKQTFFIESVILGTEIPPIIFFKSGLKLEVIDGRQRFETLKKFKENDIILNGKGLMSLVDLAKQSFANLTPSTLQGVFLESNIRVFEIEVINEPDLDSYLEDKIKKEIFRRYNTGITPLTTSEVDNARYDDDLLSERFKKELKENNSFFTKVCDCFFTSDFKQENIEDIANYLRRLYVIDRFPISKYAAGKERTEILDMLYDFSTQEIENLDSEFCKLKEEIEFVHEIYSNLTKWDIKLKNRYIYECIFWAIRILDSENFPIDNESKILNIREHYINNINLYSNEGSYFYSNIINRFTNTGELFNTLYGFDFTPFVRNANFTSDLKKRRSNETDSKNEVDKFDNLRTHKPSPISTPIDEIRSDIKTHRYIVRPSYQRQEKISVLKASSIIESILLNINLPPIFIFKRKEKNGIKEVIDGQQRLLSIIGFLGEQYLDEEGVLKHSKNSSYKLKGLKILSELNGKNYSNLNDEQKNKILDFTIDVIIIDQNINPLFEPTDLFIRLNNKPYPIQQNSFEMWNSTVDGEVIKKIKEVTRNHISWFHIKEVKLKDEERNDRMENEELVTILSYITYYCRSNNFDKIIGFFKWQDRITCRLVYKTGLTDFLIKLEKDITEKQLFMDCIQITNSFILKLMELLGGDVNKDKFNSILNVKGGITFRRSLQDFYIIWIIMAAYYQNDDFNLNSEILIKIDEMLKKLRNVSNKKIEDSYAKLFTDELKSFYK